MNVQLVNTALSKRNMLPIDGYCSCVACGDSELFRDEMAPANAEIEGLYVGSVCKSCAGNILKCSNCDGPVLKTIEIDGAEVGTCCAEQVLVSDNEYSHKIATE